MKKQIKFFMLAGALLGATAVMLGAFAAHGLKQYLDTAQIEVIETALHYQLTHAIFLFVLSIWLTKYPSLLPVIACWLLLIGILLFSGSLYLLTLWQIPVGIITPIGGLSLISAWLVLVIYSIK